MNKLHVDEVYLSLFFCFFLCAASFFLVNKRFIYNMPSNGTVSSETLCGSCRVLCFIQCACV